MKLFLTILLLMMVASPASARIESLRWTHNDPANVAGFMVYYGLSSGDYTTSIDALSIQPDVAGIFTFDIDVPDDATIYVVVTAYDSGGLESAYSNERVRAPRFLFDADGDGVVGMIDFGLFIQAFETDDPVFDSDGDGVVGFIDFGAFTLSFGKCNNGVVEVPCETL